jgi:hypothetical protein
MHIEDNDFKRIGPDFVTNMTNKDMEFAQDANKLNSIALNRLFKIDNMPKLILYMILAIEVIILVKG